MTNHVLRVVGILVVFVGSLSCDKDEVWMDSFVDCTLAIMPRVLSADTCVSVVHPESGLVGYCMWDALMANRTGEGCMCPATYTTCTEGPGRSECYWHQESRSCITNAERFHTVLAQQLEARGKDDFSLNIRFGGALAKSKEPEQKKSLLKKLLSQMSGGMPGMMGNMKMPSTTAAMGLPGMLGMGGLKSPGMGLGGMNPNINLGALSSMMGTGGSKLPGGMGNMMGMGAGGMKFPSGMGNIQKLMGSGGMNPLVSGLGGSSSMGGMPGLKKLFASMKSKGMKFPGMGGGLKPSIGGMANLKKLFASMKSSRNPMKLPGIGGGSMSSMANLLSSMKQNKGLGLGGIPSMGGGSMSSMANLLNSMKQNKGLSSGGIPSMASLMGMGGGLTSSNSLMQAMKSMMGTKSVPLAGMGASPIVGLNRPMMSSSAVPSFNVPPVRNSPSAGMGASNVKPNPPFAQGAAPSNSFAQPFLNAPLNPQSFAFPSLNTKQTGSNLNAQNGGGSFAPSSSYPASSTNSASGGRPSYAASPSFPASSPTHTPHAHHVPSYTQNAPTHTHQANSQDQNIGAVKGSSPNQQLNSLLGSMNSFMSSAGPNSANQPFNFPRF